MPYYEMRLNLLEKLSDLSQATIGRQPLIIWEGGRGRIIKLEFVPDLTPAERTALLNAMPEWVRFLYTFEMKPGTLQRP